MTFSLSFFLLSFFFPFFFIIIKQMPSAPAREHSVDTIRRNSEVMGNLRKLLVANRGVSDKTRACTLMLSY